MTVVGDIAQATGAWANDGWDNVLAQLPQKREVRRRELSIGYRIPGPAMTLANLVLPHAAPGLRPPQPVRNDGDPPIVRRLERLEAGLETSAWVREVVLSRAFPDRFRLAIDLRRPVLAVHAGDVMRSSGMSTKSGSAR